MGSTCKEKVQEKFSVRDSKKLKVLSFLLSFWSCGVTVQFATTVINKFFNAYMYEFTFLASKT